MKALRDLVWVTYMGPDTFRGVCWCCSSVAIDALHFECGHVQAEAMGGECSVENLRPICHTCNTSMGKRNMFAFMRDCHFPSAKVQCIKRKSQDSV
jgi:hypothetical protein